MKNHLSFMLAALVIAFMTLSPSASQASTPGITHTSGPVFHDRAPRVHDHVTHVHHA